MGDQIPAMSLNERFSVPRSIYHCAPATLPKAAKQDLGTSCEMWPEIFIPCGACFSRVSVGQRGSCHWLLWVWWNKNWFVASRRQWISQPVFFIFSILVDNTKIGLDLEPIFNQYGSLSLVMLFASAVT